MKVLMIGNHESVHGGITSVIHQLLSYNWTKDRIEMRFIPSYKGGNVVNKVIFFIAAYNKIKKSIKKDKPNVVHVHMSHHGSFDRAYIIYRLCKKYSISVVVHLHGSEFVKYYEECSTSKKKDIKAFFGGCSSVITLGDEWGKFVSTIAPQTNIIVLNNTVHIPESFAEQPEDKINFLFLGVLFKRKGVADLLCAIKKVINSGCVQNKNIIFNIGGTGPEEDSLKDFVEANDIGMYVNFLGWIDGKEKEIQLMKNQVFILPSYNEGLPIAILEALSYGIPVISTDVGSINEAVQNGINGYLFKPGDVEGYYVAISELITNYELRCSMARASRRIAENCFDQKKYFEKIVEIYKNSI